MRMMSCDQLDLIMSIINIWNCRRESNVIRNMNVIGIDHVIMKDPDLENDIEVNDHAVEAAVDNHPSTNAKRIAVYHWSLLIAYTHLHQKKADAVEIAQVQLHLTHPAHPSIRNTRKRRNTKNIKSTLTMITTKNELTVVADRVADHGVEVGVHQVDPVVAIVEHHLHRTFPELISNKKNTKT